MYLFLINFSIDLIKLDFITVITFISNIHKSYKIIMIIPLELLTTNNSNISMYSTQLDLQNNLNFIIKYTHHFYMKNILKFIRSNALSSCSYMDLFWMINISPGCWESRERITLDQTIWYQLCECHYLFWLATLIHIALLFYRHCVIGMIHAQLTADWNNKWME